MTQPLPYDWVRSAAPELIGLDELMTGVPPPFPWEDFSRYLGEALQSESFSIAPPLTQWRESSSLLESISQPAVSLKFTASGTPGAVWLAVSENDLARLFAALLHTDSLATDLHQLDRSYLQGFHTFLALQLLHSLSAFQFDQAIPYALVGESPMPEQACLCLDFWISTKEVKFLARLAVPSEFQKAWAARYAVEPKDLLLYAAASEQVYAIVHLEAGRVTLTQQQWRNVNPGDVIILDSCTAQPDLSKTKVVLTVHGMPCYRGRLKKGALKILEFPLILNADDEMSDEYNEDETYNTESTDNTDMTAEEDFSEEFSEEATDENHVSEIAEEDEEDQAEDAEAQQQQAVTEEISLGTQTQPTEAVPLTSPEQIPLTLVVELGRIQMTVQQLVAMQPGNVIELDIDPEQGIDLVVTGRKVARGELIRIGEHFGVRIIERG